MSRTKSGCVLLDGGRTALLAAAVLLIGTVLIVSTAGKVRAADGPGKFDFRETVQKAKEKVFPSVVYIKCIKETHEAGKKISQEMAGSGVVISKEGEVLTNHHVIDKASSVRCLLSDGRAFEAEVLGSDKDTDLALLKLKGLDKDPKPVPVAAIGDSSVLKEGDFVMAMGAPWGLARSVSIGIVACTDRYLESRSEYSLWIQTDASISPGNSGGPLVNTNGEIVGINTLGIMSGGDLGFSIPSDTVKFIISQIRTHGRVNWSWTGLRLQPLRDFNKDIYFEATEGVMVAGTEQESPARRVGLKTRDRIIEINGEKVTALTAERLPDVRRKLGLLDKGKPATLTLVRNGKTMTIKLTPTEKGKVEGEELDCPRWDFTLKTINRFDNKQLYFHQKVGVFVYGIKYPGNASNAGLNRNDILLKIGKKKVKTLDEVKAVHTDAIDNIKKGHRVLLTVLRNGVMRMVVLDFERDYEKE